MPMNGEPRWKRCCCRRTRRATVVRAHRYHESVEPWLCSGV
jgi:hypothetical protein